MNRPTRKLSALAAMLVACCLLMPQAFGKSGQLEIHGCDVQSQAVAVSVVNTADTPLSGYVMVEALLGNDRVRSTVAVQVMGGEQVVVTVAFGTPVAEAIVVGIIDDLNPM